ncbi:TolB family protein [Streptosporangium carneum]|uniref:Uncharacterized protein n=1 Tax=Streptosporangium carneum TaxID=47481 RepID=A0A9W6ME62_9ACTN|nr:hypothetical protein [Streptosporangium carneum]GLK11229.1 hypothetical protein GCM10017600_46350 [Streptosporangium carneum]
MSDDLEDHLRSALGHASERAPQAPNGLPAQVMAHSRRRRARAQALVAAVAVVAVAGGVGVAAHGSGGVPASGTLSPAQTPSVEILTSTPSPSGGQASEGPDPVEKVWPQAVWKIPAKLPDGRAFRPKTFIDDRTLLLETWERPGKADALYSYELDSGRTRKIADIGGPDVFPFAYAVGDGRIVWQENDSSDKGWATRFRSVPVTGGEPETITTDRRVLAVDNELAVVGDRLVFSEAEGKGVFTVPLEGGALKQVKGTERHRVVRWPWVGVLTESVQNLPENYERLLNVDTGETSRAVVRPGERRVRCGVKECAGGRADGTLFHRLRDGSQEGDLPGSVPMGLAADRFHTFETPGPRRGQVLYDLVTGKSGDLGLPFDIDGPPISLEPGLGNGRLLAYPRKGEYVIINLTKIP